MALQYKDTLRNAQLNQIETTVGTGALQILAGTVPANVTTADAGAILADLNLPVAWLTTASGGSVSIEGGPWTDASANNTGTATHFRIYNSTTTKNETTCIIQGTYGVSASDMIGDSVSFTAGQSFSITAFTISAGNA